MRARGRVVVELVQLCVYSVGTLSQEPPQRVSWVEGSVPSTADGRSAARCTEAGAAARAEATLLTLWYQTALTDKLLRRRARERWRDRALSPPPHGLWGVKKRHAKGGDFTTAFTGAQTLDTIPEQGVAVYA